MSIIETTLNISSGFILSMVCWSFFVVPLIDNVFNGDIKNFYNNFIITTIFTILSFARSFIWRRIFNHMQYKHIIN